MSQAMHDPTLTCRDEQRRHQIRRQKLNGLDFLEVDDSQTTLCVHFLGEVPRGLTKANIRIEGGQRIRDIQVLADPQIDSPGDRSLDSCLRIYLNKYGDFSTYILRLVEPDPDKPGNFKPLRGLDPRYSWLEFTFKAGCPTDLDCQSQPVCPPEERTEPEINYLAKDYASFRQLILDRLSLTLPDWQERHIPDLGIALVELLAYVGDHLSYYQDAVATEAYLQTARQRISVRRHVRLVDYLMHEGCNARTWVWINTDADFVLKPGEIFFITTYPGAPEPGAVLNQQDDLRNIPPGQYEVFEPVATQSIQLYQAHNEMHVYTWGDRQCCLPKGATTATLRDDWIAPPKSDPKKKQEECPPDPCDDGDNTPPPLVLNRKLHLKEGDILIFEEVRGAKTGDPADADPTHRHAVRLIQVQLGEDPAYPQRVENVPQEMPTPIVEITWSVEDALPFPLCISGLGPAPECELLDNITLVRGNVILVDHGKTVVEELDPVEEKATIAQCEAEGEPTEVIFTPQLFCPPLKQLPLTFRQQISLTWLAQASATELVKQEPRGALPQIYLQDAPVTTAAQTQLNSLPNAPSNPLPTNTVKWTPTLDLIDNQGQAIDIFWNGNSLLNSAMQHSAMQRFCVEMDNDGVAHLRFGDGDMGQVPTVGTHFRAVYRLGNGWAGNVGANTIAHLVFRASHQSGRQLKPHNPLPAKGGTPPEPLLEVKQFAPATFRKDLQRAITPQDYADLVMRDFKPKVQRAAAILRWTGSWYEVLVAVDPIGSEAPEQALLDEIAARLHRYRRIGHDLVVQRAVYVSLHIALQVCVLPGYLRGHVKAALLEVFSNRLLADGRRGFFHPDNLTFGGGVYLSQLVATAQAVPGVMSVTVTKLERFAEGPNQELETGILRLAPLEIARLDNDPSFPENGKFELVMGGGR